MSRKKVNTMQKRFLISNQLLFLTFCTWFIYTTYMENKTVKTYIKRLHKRYKTHEAVGVALGISKRYVIYLENGERVPSEHLRKLIKVMLK